MGRVADISLLPAYWIPHAAALGLLIGWTTSLKLVCAIYPLFPPMTYIIHRMFYAVCLIRGRKR